MSEDTASSVVLKIKVDEGPPLQEHFDIVLSPAPTSISDGDILIQVLSISADPYLRGAMKSTGTMEVGSPIKGFVAGKVLQSKNDKWKEGDLFGGLLPFTTIQIVSASTLAHTPMWKLTDVIDESEIALGVGALGMPGCTAHGGLLKVLRPQQGEIIFVSAAAGAVGSLVGQLAKQLFGCTVIGSCGGPEKCKMIKEKFGFDHAIDYKTISSADELKAAIKQYAPDGIDMYFENVGGMHFDAALASLRTGGRIAVCGGISMYNEKSPPMHAFNPMQLVYTRQRIEGFIVFPWLLEGTFVQEMAALLKAEKLKAEETHFIGIDNWPKAFISLFTGGNVGKVVVHC